MEKKNIGVFGANGKTGRFVVEQGLDAGYEITAVTRSPQTFPFRREGLHVVQADAHDSVAVANAIVHCDAVISTLGVRFTRDPITVYSIGVMNIVGAMRQHGLRRLILVSSSATYPHYHADGGFFLNAVMQPLVTATIGRTTYADMRRMEEYVRQTDLEWTIVRPSGLFDLPYVTRYRLDEDEAPGVFTSRADLAACMLEQLADARYIRKNLAVTTTEVKPSMLRLLLNEALRRP